MLRRQPTEDSINARAHEPCHILTAQLSGWLAVHDKLVLHDKLVSWSNDTTEHSVVPL